jgi:hypothetical protein
MLDEIRSDDRPVLAGLSPDHLHGTEKVTTFFYGLTDHTLYTDSTPDSYHRKVLRERPEMIGSILPSEVFRRHEAGEFLESNTGNVDDERYSGSAMGGLMPLRVDGNRTWETVAAFALLGRLGVKEVNGNLYGVVSLWPESLAGIPGKLAPMAGRLDGIPAMLRALKGEGKIVHYAGPVAIDDRWLLVIPDLIGPISVGEYLNVGADDDDEDQEEEDDEELMGWEGGSCTRCGMYLDEGYCPNDRCPFSHCYQDEMIEDWKYPGRAEKAYIKKLQEDSKD